MKLILFFFLQDIDIKCPYQGAVTAYAFIQYPDIRSVVKAQKLFSGEVIGQKAKVCSDFV